MTTTTPIPTSPAATTAEAFAERLVGVLDDASLALMLSIGHQVGLFDVLADLPPATSSEVAAAAGLHERYVREWLAAMTVGRVVEHDPASGTYRLPEAQAACLTRAAGLDNLAGTMQFIPLLARVEDGVVEAFRRGGGVGYEAFPTFHRLMAEDSANVHDAILLDHIVPLVAGLHERLTAGIDAADIGCGSGHAVNLLAGAYPASRFTGYDFSEQAIRAARAEAASLGLANARFEVVDVATLDAVDALDLVTAFDAIHDQAQPAAVLANVARALRPGGTFLMVDIDASSDVLDNLDRPAPVFLYTVSTMHCMTVSLSQGGVGLGTAWGHRVATRMLQEAGFAACEIAAVDGDWFNSYYVATKG